MAIGVGQSNGDHRVPVFLSHSRGSCSAGRLDHPVGLDAAGANPDCLGLAVHQRPYPLKVGVEATRGFIISVAYVVPKLGPLPTDLAHPSHGRHRSWELPNAFNVAVISPLGKRTLEGKD